MISTLATNFVKLKDIESPTVPLTKGKTGGICNSNSCCTSILGYMHVTIVFFHFFSAVDCGSPPSVNGVLGTVSRTEYLDTAMVTCTVGYTRFGLTAQLICNASSATATTGVWTGTMCTGK